MTSIFDDMNDRDHLPAMVGHDELTMDQYQDKATQFAIYPTTLVYPTLGLTGEAGEVAEKVKKLIRDHDLDLTADDVADQLDYTEKRDIALEVGDILWYCANLLNDIDYSMEEAAQLNLDKLADRTYRGVIPGNGDHR